MDTSDGTNSDGALLESTWVTGQHIMQFQSLDASQAFDSHAWPANAVVHEPLPQQMMQQVDLEAVPDPSADPPAMGHSTLHGVVLAEPMGGHSHLQVPLPMLHSTFVPDAGAASACESGLVAGGISLQPAGHQLCSAASHDAHGHGTNSDGALLESTWVTGQHIMQFQSLDANQAFDSHAWPANAVVHEPLPQHMVQQVGLEPLHGPNACPPAMGHSTHHGVVLAEPMGSHSQLEMPLPMLHSIPGSCQASSGFDAFIPDGGAVSACQHSLFCHDQQVVDLQHMDSGELGSSPHASSFLPQSLPDFQPQGNALPVPNSSHSFEASSVPPNVPHNMPTHGFGGDTLANGYR